MNKSAVNIFVCFYTKLPVRRNRLPAGDAGSSQLRLEATQLPCLLLRQQLPLPQLLLQPPVLLPRCGKLLLLLRKLPGLGGAPCLGIAVCCNRLGTLARWWHLQDVPPAAAARLHPAQLQRQSALVSQSRLQPLPRLCCLPLVVGCLALDAACRASRVWARPSGVEVVKMHQAASTMLRGSGKASARLTALTY